MRLRYHQSVLALECLEELGVEHTTVLPPFEEFVVDGFDWVGIDAVEIEYVVGCYDDVVS